MAGNGGEHAMPGGFVNTVVRVGDTVRRLPPANAEFSRRLLRFFEERGWAGAPRHLGVDGQGRDVLSYIDGLVPWQSAQHERVRTADALVAVARLVRLFHDLTAHSELAGDDEVVCHNDLSPKNTVYRHVGPGLVPVAFIDWDLAAPGRRIHDVAHMCWQYADLGPDVRDAAESAGLVRLLADAYGLTDRSRLVDTILWWQDRCWRGIEAGADAGDQAMRRLRDQGGALRVRASHRWTLAHRHTLERALS